LIIRFNNAPTEGYEEDVGALTSLRIVNSQVVTKNEFGFPHSSALIRTTNGSFEDFSYSDSIWDATRKYLLWDPCNYSSNIAQVMYTVYTYDTKN